VCPAHRPSCIERRDGIGVHLFNQPSTIVFRLSQIPPGHPTNSVSRTESLTIDIIRHVKNIERNPEDMGESPEPKHIVHALRLRCAAVDETHNIQSVYKRCGLRWPTVTRQPTVPQTVPVRCGACRRSAHTGAHTRGTHNSTSGSTVWQAFATHRQHAAQTTGPHRAQHIDST
jgi:hypothetical protein